MELSPAEQRGVARDAHVHGVQRYYCWFALEARAAPPDVEDTLRLTVPVRRAVTVQITLKNPTPKPAAFRVDVEGHGLLARLCSNARERRGRRTSSCTRRCFPAPRRGWFGFEVRRLASFGTRLDSHAQPAETETVPEMVSEVGGEREKVTLERG